MVALLWLILILRLKLFFKMVASDYVGRKERNVLFNEPLNTFYLGLYGIGHKVKDPFIFLSQTEEPAKAGTCACDRRELQSLF